MAGPSGGEGVPSARYWEVDLTGNLPRKENVENLDPQKRVLL